jgi:SAM-dependent methyltransferase
MICRHCASDQLVAFLDLGFAPPSNAYLSEEDLAKPEKHFPLRVSVCTVCWLVQTEDYAEAEELFTPDYAYFSGTSSTWVQHVTAYVEQMVDLLSLTEKSFVIEVASNDGHLLRNFVSKGVPCLGIEPTKSTAEASRRLDIPVLEEFFGEAVGAKMVQDDLKADLVIGNNVFAHVPDINDFTKGLKLVLKAGGTITLEFPHLQELIEHVQFDTVYHEHFSYLSLFTVSRIFAQHGLRIWHAERLSTHGGSLRIYGCHGDDSRESSEEYEAILNDEKLHGLQSVGGYSGFQQKVEKIRDDLLFYLVEKKREGKMVVAYGAAAKGNTLLNFAGVKGDLVSSVYDAAPSKQGKFLPGSHIPIFPPETFYETAADHVLILPWNISEEIITQIDELTSRKITYVRAIPKLVVA